MLNPHSRIAVPVFPSCRTAALSKPIILHVKLVCSCSFPADPLPELLNKFSFSVFRSLMNMLNEETLGKILSGLWCGCPFSGHLLSSTFSCYLLRFPFLSCGCLFLFRLLCWRVWKAKETKPSLFAHPAASLPSSRLVWYSSVSPCWLFPRV